MQQVLGVGRRRRREGVRKPVVPRHERAQERAAALEDLRFRRIALQKRGEIDDEAPETIQAKLRHFGPAAKAALPAPVRTTSAWGVWMRPHSTSR